MRSKRDTSRQGSTTTQAAAATFPTSSSSSSSSSSLWSDLDDSDECGACGIGPPPPDDILWIPPPPLPSFLLHRPGDHDSGLPHDPGGSSSHGPSNSDSSTGNDGPNGIGPCPHVCDWSSATRGGHNPHFVEVPGQGTFLDDTWLLLLISSFIGIIFVGIVITTWMLRCRLYRQPEELGQQPNDDASQCSGRSNKNSTLSTSTATSSVHTTTTSGSGCSGRHHFAATMPRLHEAVLAYPCPIATGFATHQNHNNNPQNLQQTQQDDPRLMWATLTPRGTTRHYLEEHTYETIGGPGSQPQASQPPPPPPPPPDPQHQPPPAYEAPDHGCPVGLPASERHKYNEPPIPTPVLNRPRIEKAFDNTAFVDYEEPLPTRNEYYQLDNVHEPCDPIFSVQGLYGLAGRFGAGGTLQRPRVSSPTRIENPNLPPLNRQTTRPRRLSSRHHHQHHHHHHNQHQLHQRQRAPSVTDCEMLRPGPGNSYVPTM